MGESTALQRTWVTWPSVFLPYISLPWMELVNHHIRSFHFVEEPECAQSYPTSWCLCPPGSPDMRIVRWSWNMSRTPFSGSIAVPYLPSQFFLLRFFVVWLCRGPLPLWPRVRCVLPLQFLHFLVFSGLQSAGSGPFAVFHFFISFHFLSLAPLCAECWHGASRYCSVFFFLHLFFSLRSCVLAALVLDGRLEPQASAGGSLTYWCWSPTKPNQTKFEVLTPHLSCTGA